jgi:hypothetical protein
MASMERLFTAEIIKIAPLLSYPFSFLCALRVLCGEFFSTLSVRICG